MASYSIARMRAVGAFYGAKLKAAGIRSTATLLERARTPKGRKLLAEQTAIPECEILRWANMADLMRVRGVARDYAELLEASGVGTVKALRHRNPSKLAARMQEVNKARALVEMLPSEKRIARWIEEAKSLDPMMTY
ncbi:DUF4332 domain-containing protein [Propylenella binzhouense]|uniref:DUF4332 domain-containing protein n=1 Tax=Propylenella binzhouense TaxID=2555902 RepID=A0A964T4L7_9HYPH|nr:DUF4332 domain-containing protein [Propylenella binzhouense]MYZ48398.1 DUF4332 domain-containing protein [Propylenella binzhouense]